MKAKLVKFEDDGTQCKRDIEYLRRHPECGVPFIQDKPFKPDNPKYKFRPHNRNFSIDILDRTIPTDPNIPDAPPIGKPPKMGEAVGPSPYTNQYLPQDYTNYQQGGRRPIGEYLEYNKRGGYSRLPVANDETDIRFPVPRIGNTSYSHETPARPSRPIGDVELEDFGAGVGIPNERPPPTLRSERIRLTPSRAPLPDERDTEFVAPRAMTDEEEIETTRPVADVELEDFGAGVGIPYQRPPPTLRSERIRLRPSRAPLPDERDTEFVTTEKINITDLPEEIKDYIISTKGRVPNKIDVTVLKNDLAELEDLVEGYEEDRQMVRDEMIRNVNEGNELLAEENIRFLGRHAGNKNDLLNLKNKLKETQRKITQRRVLSPTKRPLKPRGMTDEELIDAQIEQLTRNSTQEEAKQVEQSIRENRGKGRAKVKPTEQEMFPISPDSEELVFLKEIDKILKPGEIDLTIQQKNNLTRELLSRGFSRERIGELLDKYEAYDSAVEEATRGRPRTEEERLMRSLRSGIRSIPIRDTNLLPERQPSIELREDTPLVRGRTDIAPGRTRVEKVYDRVAGKLPEELRTLAGSVKRNAQAFNENVRTKSLEAIQSISARTTRTFGQRYTSITEEAQQIRGLQEIGTESGTIIDAPEGNINIREPVTEDITGIRPNDLQALGSDPLGRDYQDTTIGGARPKLTYAERIQRARAGAFSAETGVAAGGAAGGVLIGFGVAELMKNVGVHNKYAIAAGAGGAGGAGARILTMAGSRALTTTAQAGTEAVAEGATYAAIRSGTSILRGAGEGAVVGLALMPVDMLLNNAFVNAGASHAVANVSSGAIVGGLGTAATTIGLASLGAAPETLGASLLVGGAAMAVTSIIGLFTGIDQDNKEKEAKEKAQRARDELNSTGKARQQLLQTLPTYNYDFTKALNAFVNKDALGINNDTWNTFSSSAKNMFKPRPNNSPPQTPTSGEPPTGEQKRINDLFSKYITHELINRVCTGGSDCKELRTHDQGALTEDEVNFLNDKTGSTWQTQANMQVEMSVQELNYTRQRIGNAQMEMLNAWNNERKVANQLDPYIVQTAQLDPSFRQKYDLALKLDAQQQIVDAYQKDQTKMEQLPKNVRDMANLDPDFSTMIHAYYDTMETTSGQLQVTIPQLIQLQKLTGDAQRTKYQEFQFDNIKQDPVIVNEAQEIASEEDQVRQAGFYDIDQAFLETDPTAINTWHPSDSQILQAHAAGMNLNEYVEYMHQLAKGKAGDYSNLPKYTDAQLRASGLLDYSHFQDELQMAGYRKDLYLYDPETRQFTLNPNVTNSAIPSTQNKFISDYTPRYLLQARQEYADMIHGLNEKNQNEVDNFNANLMKELSSYGKHYDSVVANINDERLYEGRSDLLYYDVGKIYNQNKIEFNSFSDKLTDAPDTGNIISQDAAKGRQLNEEIRAEKKREVAERYGLSVSEYNQVKQDTIRRGIRDPTQEEFNQSVQNVKNRETQVVATSGGTPTNVTNITPNQGSQLQQNFRRANPNLNPNTNFTDSQINTLNQGGSVNVNNQNFASA